MRLSYGATVLLVVYHAPQMSRASEHAIARFFGDRYFFLHIPKTAGTSIEELLPVTASLHGAFLVDTWNHKQRLWVMKRRHNLTESWGKYWRKHKLSPWHWPPDIYERRINRSFSHGRPIFCVVRNPLERLRSRLDYEECTLNRSAPDIAREVRELTAAAAQPPPYDWLELEVPPSTAIGAHAIPQAWFVWSQFGDVQCHCVIAFEKLARMLNKKKVTHGAHDTRNCESAFDASGYAALRRQLSAGKLPPAWWLLHAADLSLWRSAVADASFCHRPAALAQLFGHQMSSTNCTSESAATTTNGVRSPILTTTEAANATVLDPHALPLGATKPGVRPWTVDEHARLMRMHAAREPLSTIARRLNRTVGGLRVRLRHFIAGLPDTQYVAASRPADAPAPTRCP